MPTYITKNRALVEAIKNISGKLSIHYSSSADDWIICLTKNDLRKYIYSYSFDCNSHAAASIANDKSATYDILAQKNIQAVPHWVIKSVLDEKYNLSKVQELLSSSVDIVVKPLHGSRGRSIARFSESIATTKFMNSEDETLWAVSPHIVIEYELRIVVYDEEILMVYKKFEPLTINNLKMFNLNLGAKASLEDTSNIPETIKTMAAQAAKAINLTFCAVDIVKEVGKGFMVLEINSGFSLEHFAQMDPANRRKVILLYETVVKRMFTSRDD